MARFFGQLYVKLALVFLLLLAVVALVQVRVLGRTWAGIAYSADEILHTDLASQLAVQLQPILIKPIDYYALRKRLFELKQILPRVDIYVLDEQGRIKAHFGPHESLARTSVELGPIKQFLDEAAAGKSDVLLGSNPSSESDRGVFSAAPVQIAEKNGYLYAVLAGQQHNLAVALARQEYYIKSGTSVLATTVLVAAAAGLIAFFLLTRRLRRLKAQVETFAAGDYSLRVHDHSGDEIAAVGAVFNSMAEKIVEDMRLLEDKDRLRRELVTDISHDIGSPLTGLQLNLEVLQEEGRSIDQERHAQIIAGALKNTDYIRTLMTELLELSKLEANEIACIPAAVSPQELASELEAAFRASAEAKGASLQIEVAPGAPHVRADRSLIERALGNLFTNAVQHTPDSGTVTLRVAQAGGRVRFEIADSGPGIPESERRQLFQRFYRTDAARRSGRQGTGLGLSIVREILRQHDSEIEVLDNRPQGSIFAFSLPIAPSPEPLRQGRTVHRD